MSLVNHIQRSVWRALILVSALALGACDAVNDAVDRIDDIGNEAEVYYYVSIGTSLAVGVQPNGDGNPLPTDDGYADELFDLIRPTFEAAGAQPRELRLVRLGCPGETLDDLINGGSCPYVAGSQLDAAVDYLNDNGDKVYLLTIDIGGNDFRNEDCIDAAVDLDCANTVSAQIATDLATVLDTLNGAADPATTIVGMNYYNPFLASWLEGAAGQTLATESAQAVSVFNDFLSTTYATAGVLMADVAAAFESDDFVTLVQSAQPPPNDMLPVNVNNICELTYMCDGAPRGPDVHANDAGYVRIAEAFEAVLP